MKLAEALGDKESLAYTLEGFAGLAVRQGQVEQAARLWGAAEALHESIGSPLPPSGGRTIYEADVATARESLGETALQAAWQAGREMGLDQALAYALEAAAH